MVPLKISGRTPNEAALQPLQRLVTVNTAAHNEPKTVNPVEIEQALSDFIEEPFDAIEFPCRF